MVIVESSRIKAQNGSRAMPTLVYLSLGSNIGDRETQLRDAQVRLGAAGKIVGVSSFYETQPVDFTRQPWFLNCAVALETRQTPQQLMTSILGIEEKMGRRRVQKRRAQKKGPRTIDIDILLFGETILDSPELTIPHPAMHQRRFVLEPLAQLVPDALHPLLRKTIRQLRDALPPGQAVRRIPKSSIANDERPTT